MDSWEGSQDYTEDIDMANDDECSLKDVYRLNYFPAFLYATILEDTITQIRMLCECNNELRIIKTMADIELLRAMKYSIRQPTIVDELDGINVHRLGCMQYKLDKLAGDRKYIIDAFLDLFLSLSLQKSYSALAERISVIENRDSHRAFLIEDEAKNKTSRRELMRQLRQQRNHFKSVTYDTDLIIDKLKSKVEDATMDAEVKTRYISNWQEARIEQHYQSITDKETGPTEFIKFFRTRTDHEHRVHSEVESLTNIFISETLNKVEFWMNKYDKDMEQLDLKIQIMKNDYQNRHDKRIELENTLEEHDREMKAWVHFKDERTKARLYVEKMTNAASTVQAWWRGLLVRLQLGPYKVSKKKGAGAKKKK